MTRGRAMFGVGPGALTADADKMGIPVAEQRRRMNEAVSVLVPLLRGETVSRKTDWFELRDARLQMECYTKPMVEMAVASSALPGRGADRRQARPRHALHRQQPPTPGLAAHASNWETCETISAEHGHPRGSLPMAGGVHDARGGEPRAGRARRGVRTPALAQVFPGDHDLSHRAGSGVDDHLGYMRENGDRHHRHPRTTQSTPSSGCGEGSRGGFGCYMLFAHNWADWAQTKRSYRAHRALRDAALPVAARRALPTATTSPPRTTNASPAKRARPCSARSSATRRNAPGAASPPIGRPRGR